MTGAQPPTASCTWNVRIALRRYAAWLWAGLFLVLFAVLVVRTRREIVRTVTTLRDADVAWLLVGFVLILGGALLMLRRPATSGPLGWLSGRVGRRLHTFVDQARSHGLGSRDVLGPLARHLLVDVAGVVALLACLRAVGWHATPAQALVGYPVGTPFLRLAPVFPAVGAVE